MGLTSLRTAVRDNPEFVILDTETTGLDNLAEICQIAIINHKGETLLNSFVRAKNKMPLDAYAIHHISDEMIEDAPTWPEITELVQTIIFDKLVIIYNAEYDRRLMHQSAKLWDSDVVYWNTIARFECAMEAYSEYYGDWNAYHKSYTWQRLAIAAKRLNCLQSNAHNARADCLMALGVVKAICANIE